jgi:hypothetical protein
MPAIFSVVFLRRALICMRGKRSLDLEIGCEDLKMHTDAAVADWIEHDSEKELKEPKSSALPKRCKSCSDLPNCDLDFCLRWWH